MRPPGTCRHPDRPHQHQHRLHPHWQRQAGVRGYITDIIEADLRPLRRYRWQRALGNAPSRRGETRPRPTGTAGDGLRKPRGTGHARL